MAPRRDTPDQRMGGSRWLLPLIVVLLGVIAVVTATLIITGPVPAPFERPGRIGLDIPEIVPPNAPRLPAGRSPGRARGHAAGLIAPSSAGGS